MIKADVLFNENKMVGSCDNCNREMKLLLKYTFSDKNREWNKLYLCEDCSSALGGLFEYCMDNYRLCESYKYDLDEISKCE